MGSSHFPCGTGILLGPSSQVLLRKSEGDAAAKDALNAFGEVRHREIHRRDGKSNSSVTFAETQPQRHPALLSLSAMSSQYFTATRAVLAPVPVLLVPSRRARSLGDP